MGKRQILAVYTLFFFSGATALVYQVAWLRSLSLIFGASHDAISIVLAAFMGGMALGAYAIGRRVRSCRNPLRLYALLELAIALSAALLPSLFHWADQLYVALAIRFCDVGWMINLLRALMAAAILLIPTTLMGGTLPALIEHCVVHQNQFGRRLAGLYAINTLGAVIGTVLAGLVSLTCIWTLACPVDRGRGKCRRSLGGSCSRPGESPGRRG